MRHTVTMAARALAIVLLFAAYSAEAQTTPNIPSSMSISYQGSLQSSDGAAVPDGVHTLTFRLYGDPEGTLLLWQSSYNVQFSDGVFSVLLGSGQHPLPAPRVLDRPLWLSIQWPGMDEMRPMTKLSAVPLAMNVADGAVTREKLGTEYVPSVTIDGKSVTEGSRPLALRSGDGIKLQFDSVSGAVTLNNTTLDVGSKGPEALGNSTVTGNLDVIGQTSGGSEVYTTTGLSNSRTGHLRLKSQSNGNHTQLSADPQSANRTYTIPDAGADAKFVLTQGDQTVNGTKTFGSTTNFNASVTVANKLNVAGSSTFDDSTRFNGDTRIAGNLAVTGELTTDIIPAHQEVNLGSLEKPFKNLFVEPLVITPFPNQGGTAWYFAPEQATAPPGTAGRLRLYRSNQPGTEAFSVAPSGNIGMGITAPQDRLHVGGHLRFEGALKPGGNPGSSGQLLVSNGSGTPQWQSLSAFAATSPFWNLLGNAGTNSAGHFVGTTDNMALAFRVNNVIGNRILPFGSATPSIAGGSSSNTVTGAGSTIAGGGDAGAPNTVNGSFGSIGGGRGNVVSASGTVAGGLGNTAAGAVAAVGGGQSNSATGAQSTISGGAGNAASASFATVGGGQSNQASAYATVSGGTLNVASGMVAAVGGGEGNEASGMYATIAGGSLNKAAHLSAIPGGQRLQLGENSFGFNGSNSGTIVNLTAFSRVAYFGNVDLWLGNIDGSARELRFYAPNTSGSFIGARHTAFKAQAQSANITYTLPSTVGAAGNVLTSADGVGTLIWQAPNTTASGLTASNGVTRVVNDFQLGGPLTHTTEIQLSNHDLLLTGAGNVGIGTANPNFTLDVFGEAHVTDDAFVDESIFVGDDILFGGLLLPDGDAGNPGQVLISNGFNGTPFWGDAYTPMCEYDCGTITGDMLVWDAAQGKWVVSSFLNASSSTLTVVGNTVVTGDLSLHDNILLAGNPGSAGEVLTSNGNAPPTWQPIAAPANDAWKLTGNAGTSAGNNFLGTTDDREFEIHVFDGDAPNRGSKRVMRYEPMNTSANLIGGYSGNSVLSAEGATISGGGSAGAENLIFDDFSTIGGGQGNHAGDNLSSASGATVGGGTFNSAAAAGSTIAGGQYNSVYAYGNAGTVAGGEYNSAQAVNAAVGGGSHNAASGANATVAGGLANLAAAVNATVSGGESNTVSDEGATIAGGTFNEASAAFAVIGGGNLNAVEGAHSTIAGGNENSITGAGINNAILGGGENVIVASDHASISGGFQNVIDGSGTSGTYGSYSTIGGGNQNRNQGYQSVIGGGASNFIGNTSNNTIAGGEGNSITEAYQSTVGGGSSNQIVDGYYGTIAGGISNRIDMGSYNTIGGGSGNFVRGQQSTISGGDASEIWGNSSAIAGGGHIRLGDRSFAYNAADIIDAVDLTASGFERTAYFGDVDVWIGNVEGSQRQLRFYSPNTALDYSGAVYTSFSASPNQSSIIDYALPESQGASNSILANDGSGTLRWESAGNLLTASSLPTGSGSYIQNQNAAAQSLANFWISGNGEADGRFSAGTHVNAGTYVNAGTVYKIANSTVLSAAGSGNIWAGFSAGQSNSSGTLNAALGVDALKSNVIGWKNTAVGYQALMNNLWNVNTAVGYRALANNTQASGNTAVGSEALLENTTGSGNTAFGAMALRNNFTGGTNTAIGIASLNNNSGNGNIAVGHGSMQANDAGSENVAVGNYAIGQSWPHVGQKNSVIGNYALYTNVTGSNNVAFGYESAKSNVSGSGNTIIGTNADVGSGSLANASAIGFRSMVTASNSMILGAVAGVNGATSSTNVGIGTTAPIERLEVKDGNLLLSGGASAGQLRFAKPATNIVTSFQASTSQASNIAYTLPALQGATNAILTNNGSGVLSWQSVGSLAGGNFIQNQNSIAQSPGTFYISGVGRADAAFNTGDAYQIRSLKVLAIQESELSVASIGSLFLGVRAGLNITAGYSNTFLGHEAGYSVTEGYGNTFTGRNSGRATTDGIWNTFNGEVSGLQTTSGTGNTFMGAYSGRGNVTGSDNTYIGVQAGDDPNSTGDANTYVGASAKGASGSRFNTLLGAGTGIGSSVTNATAIGYNAHAHQSNTVILGTDADAGIHTFYPQSELEIGAKGTVTLTARDDDPIPPSAGTWKLYIYNDGVNPPVLRIMGASGLTTDVEQLQ